MSYAKMMKRSGAKGMKKRTGTMHLGFNTLGDNERRATPWLGSAYYDLSLGQFSTEEEMTSAREARFKAWEEETERLLKINPDLKII